MVKYLIEKGSDVHVIDKYNRSCLHWAAMNKHYDVVKELLNAGNAFIYQCRYLYSINTYVCSEQQQTYTYSRSLEGPF